MAVVRISKFQKNPLLGRKQCVVEVAHAGEAPMSKTAIAEKLARDFKVGVQQVVIFGLKTKFGGAKSSGFCFIYDNEAAQRRAEPKYRLARSGLVQLPAQKVTRSNYRAFKNKIARMSPAERRKAVMARNAKK